MTNPAAPIPSLGGRPDPMLLPYERRGRCLVEYRCGSPGRGGTPCGALMASIFETPWGDIVTAFDKIPVPPPSMRAAVKGTVPNAVQPISFYLDRLELLDLRCRRHRRHVVGMPGDEWRQDALDAKQRSKKLVVTIPVVEWASE